VSGRGLAWLDNYHTYPFVDWFRHISIHIYNICRVSELVSLCLSMLGIYVHFFVIDLHGLVRLFVHSLGDDYHRYIVISSKEYTS
jgi:hypothetical protein